MGTDSPGSNYRNSVIYLTTIYPPVYGAFQRRYRNTTKVQPNSDECYQIEATVGPQLQGVSAEILSFPQETNNLGADALKLGTISL